MTNKVNLRVSNDEAGWDFRYTWFPLTFWKLWMLFFSFSLLLHVHESLCLSTAFVHSIPFHFSGPSLSLTVVSFPCHFAALHGKQTEALCVGTPHSQAGLKAARGLCRGCGRALDPHPAAAGPGLSLWKAVSTSSFLLMQGERTAVLLM